MPGKRAADEAADRRGLRKKLRQDAETIKNNRDNMLADRNGAFGKTLEKVEETGKEVTKPRENVLDAENFEACAKILQLRTADLNSSDCTKPEIELVIRGLRQKFTRNAAFDWCAMGAASAVFFRRVPTMSLLRGPLSVQAKAPKARAARRARQMRKPGTVLAASDAAPAAGDTSTKETTMRIDTLHTTLFNETDDGDGGVNTIEANKLLTQPASFAQTVENFFDFAFLLRWGRAGLRYDSETGEMLVERVIEHREDATQGATQGATQSSGSSSDDVGATQQDPTRHGVGSAESQAVVTLNMAQYKAVLKAFKLRKGLIADRSAGKPDAERLPASPGKRKRRS